MGLLIWNHIHVMAVFPMLRKQMVSYNNSSNDNDKN